MALSMFPSTGTHVCVVVGSQHWGLPRLLLTLLFEKISSWAWSFKLWLSWGTCLPVSANAPIQCLAAEDLKSGPHVCTVSTNWAISQSLMQLIYCSLDITFTPLGSLQMVIDDPISILAASYCPSWHWWQLFAYGFHTLVCFIFNSCGPFFSVSFLCITYFWLFHRYLFFPFSHPPLNYFLSCCGWISSPSLVCLSTGFCWHKNLSVQSSTFSVFEVTVYTFSYCVSLTNLSQILLF